MKTCSFPKSCRLLRSADFRKAYDKGKMIRSQAFQLFYLDRGEDKPARLGITVTKKFGKAVRRNRIRRLIREAFRLERSRLKPGIDIVINVRSRAEISSRKEASEELKSLLSKAGLNSGAEKD